MLAPSGNGQLFFETLWTEFRDLLFERVVFQYPGAIGLDEDMYPITFRRTEIGLVITCEQPLARRVGDGSFGLISPKSSWLPLESPHEILATKQYIRVNQVRMPVADRSLRVAYV